MNAVLLLVSLLRGSDDSGVYLLLAGFGRAAAEVGAAFNEQFSRMRALEFQRPMLRATNTGATAIINARGEVTHRLPSGVQAALTASVQGVEDPVTPYARWVSAWGLWPLVALCLGVFVVVAWQSSQRRHGHRRFGP